MDGWTEGLAKISSFIQAGKFIKAGTVANSGSRKFPAHPFKEKLNPSCWMLLGLATAHRQMFPRVCAWTSLLAKLHLA